MTRIWAFIRHNSGIVISTLLVTVILVWCYGCPSTVVSIHNPPALVTRGELAIEVDHFLKQAEIRFSELDQKDEFKRTLFAMAMDFMKEGKINPLAVAITLGNILGLGAVIDNVRKRTVINVLKGGNVNANKNKTPKEKFDRANI